MRSRHFALFAIALILAGSPRAAPAADAAASLAPLFAAHEGWLNASLTSSALRGKVVLVDVFTFGCINCKNVVPNLRALERKGDADLVIVGVHSPETPYEKNRGNVVESLKAQGIVWPVAIDNSFAIWKAYGVGAWPTQLLFDRRGRLRQTIVGDSQDSAVDAAIDRLLAEK
jgi:thiol-disulfide isomerase/thioredoxin